MKETRDWKEIAIEKNKRVMNFCRKKLEGIIARYSEAEYLIRKYSRRMFTTVLWKRQDELMAQGEYYFAVYERIEKENRGLRCIR